MYRLAQPGETSAPLLDELTRRIRRAGPLTWAEFIQSALYHPEYGYYARPQGQIGPNGDFLTAPEHHPAFGRLVGRRVAAIYRELGCPVEFTVVEQGAGLGGFAHGILEQLSEEGVGCQYQIVEPRQAWAAVQRERLAHFASQASWVRSLQELPPFTGLFLSNELPDAFPVHRVIRGGNEWRERLIDVQDERLVEVEGELSNPVVVHYFDRLGLLPAEDCVVEICPELRPWAGAVAGKLRAGSFLTIDYGRTAEELYRTHCRPEGTLRAYRRHTAVDPLECPGLADLTAEVDFTTVIHAATEAGMQVLAFTTQREFLLAMGWEGWLHRPDAGSRKALLELVDPRLMGGTRVLEMCR